MPRAVKTTAILIGIVVLYSHSFNLMGADNANPPTWPEFHGRGRANISPEKGLLKKWPKEGPPLLWKSTECGKGYSGVAIVGGKIFTAGDFEDQEMVLALDRDGKLLWKSPNGKAWKKPEPGSRTTPTYDDGILFHMNPWGRVAAFRADTGKEIWGVDLPEKFDAKPAYWAFAENLVVEGDKVLCMPGGTKGRVVALDKRTGQTFWANTEVEDTAAYCSPVVITYQGVRQFLSMTQKTVVSVDVQTGKLLWSHPFVPTSPQNAITPVFHDGHVFVACGHSTGGMLLKIDPDLRSATKLWLRKDLDNCHGGVILVDGKLFGSGCRLGGRNFFCADYFTGKVLQTDRTLSKVGLTCAEGMLYALNHRGTMYLLEITPQGFKIASKFELERMPDNSYLAHPVICDGRLYLRFEDKLYAFDIRRQ
jgi:outer membrane protein assembly factor BamB